MDIDSFFTDGDLSFGMDGASPTFKNFNGGKNVSRGPIYGEFEFNKYPEYGFTDDIYSYATGKAKGLQSILGIKTKAQQKFAPKSEPVFSRSKGSKKTGLADLQFNGSDDCYETFMNAIGSRLNQPSEWYVSKLSEADKKNCNKLQAVMDNIAKDVDTNNKKMATAKRGERRVLEEYNKGLELAGKKILALMNAANCTVIQQAEFNKALGVAGSPSKSSKVVLYVGIGIAALALGVVLYKKFK